MIARVEVLGQHGCLEDRHARRVRLYGDYLVVGVLGNRYATDFYGGYVPAGPRTHLLTASGVIGTVASSHARRGEPTALEVIGALADGSGTPLSWPGPPRAARRGPAPGHGDRGGVGDERRQDNNGRWRHPGLGRAGLRAGAGKAMSAATRAA